MSIVSFTQLQPHCAPNAWRCSRPGAEPGAGSLRREGSVFQKRLSLARESDLTLLRQGDAAAMLNPAPRPPTPRGTASVLRWVTGSSGRPRQGHPRRADAPPSHQ